LRITAEENARLAGRDVEGALADYTQAITIKPHFTEALYNRAKIRQEKGDVIGAIADFTAALKQNPKLIPAYNNRGNARYTVGDLDGAIADYTSAIHLSPHQNHFTMSLMMRSGLSGPSGI
jgi:tetratricopeptide (TPR) repeat protein